MEPRQRHWRSRLAPGDTFFATTKCLDFAFHFQVPQNRDLVAACLMSDCLRTGTLLHGYVVMPHHVHFLATASADLDPREFVCRFKANSARRPLPVLDRTAREQLREQTGLNHRTFWERGFKGLVVRSRPVFLQKMDYIHHNPIRADLCQNPEEYPWSSAWARSDRRCRADGDIDCALLLEHYAPEGLPSVSVRHESEGL